MGALRGRRLTEAAASRGHRALSSDSMSGIRGEVHVGVKASPKGRPRAHKPPPPMSKSHPLPALALFLDATSPLSLEGLDGAKATGPSPAPGRWSVQRINTSPRIGSSAWRLHLGEGLRRVRYGLAGANGSTWTQRTEEVQGQALLSLERFEVSTAELFEELKAVGAEATHAAALLMPLGEVCATRYRLAFLGEGEPSVTHGILPGSARDAAYWREDALQTSERRRRRGRGDVDSRVAGVGGRGDGRGSTASTSWPRRRPAPRHRRQWPAPGPA